VAALPPPGHRVTLIDENVEAIDFARCARADIVGVTGMGVQRRRMREILAELKARRVFTAVGGPWVTVSEGYFGDLADVVFIGEAEESWPRFLADWQRGRAARRYEQAEKTDMSTVPAPRLDLLKARHYLFGSVQFTRGCPFQCEFCDIIVVFGRRPRLKTAPQVIAELQWLRAQGFGVAFIVDDNLIGNKKAVKEILRHVARWQEENGYPLTFCTEASLDLADDPELMALMVAANIGTVFVGIESPNADSLRETRKLQNVRAGGTLVDKVRRIQAAGIEVWAGMILGFDHDDDAIFEAHCDFLADARISTAAQGRGAARRGRSARARHERAAAQDEPGDAAPGLCAADGGALRGRRLFRPARRALSRRAPRDRGRVAPLRRKAPLALAPPPRPAGAGGDRPFRAAAAARARPRAAARLPAPPLAPLAPAPGGGRAAHLRDQGGDALSPASDDADAAGRPHRQQLLARGHINSPCPLGAG
jgi:hypothetical protein